MQSSIQISKIITETLQDFWGYNSFRDSQEDIINAIISGKDTIALLPTGGGKSLCYQLPALVLEGTCLVISPLLALMKDQVQQLKSKGIEAEYLSSELDEAQEEEIYGRCIEGLTKLLYVSPERLQNKNFLERIDEISISFIAVDEAHCISEWGQDFRPSYQNIKNFRNQFKSVPCLALTATATPKVIDDIKLKLGFNQYLIFKKSFKRDNISIFIDEVSDKYQRVLDLLKHNQNSGIIYTRTRKEAENLTEFLQKNKLKNVDFFHAGLSVKEKHQKQEKWLKSNQNILISTNAFGMGIDKPDVRIVIHIDMPDSPEAYFQEAGRAGRDGQKAYAVLLYAQSDKTTLNKRISDTFPDKDYIRKVYEDINYYFQMAMGDGMGCTFAFNLDEFCRNFKHFPVQADSALKILTRAGYLEYTDEQDNASRILFTMKRDELYKLHENDTDTEKLINIILRSYTGLFTDYAYINEDSLVIRSGLTRQRIYEILLTLTRRHIIHYIPRKKTPYIIYTRERQEKNRLALTREIYEDRKKSYTTRIKAMIEYATADDKCRSRMLLRYFGEKNEHNCGQCDVCLNKHHSGIKQGEFQELEQQIKQLLQAGAMPASELLNQLNSNREKAEKVLSYLLSEEIIQLKDGILSV